MYRVKPRRDVNVVLSKEAVEQSRAQRFVVQARRKRGHELVLPKVRVRAVAQVVD